MSTTKAVEFRSECKTGCGVLTLPIPAYRLEEDNSGYRWVRCTDCGNINKVTE